MGGVAPGAYVEDIASGAWVGIPREIFANGGILVPVSNGGGPVRVAIEVLRTVLEMPDRVEAAALARADPVEVEEEVFCEEPGREVRGTLGRAGVEGGEDGRGDGVFGAGSAEVVGCLFKRCLGFSLSAFIEESCKAEKKTSA
jgi:hypothetical protein